MYYDGGALPPRLKKIFKTVLTGCVSANINSTTLVVVYFLSSVRVWSDEIITEIGLCPAGLV